MDDPARADVSTGAPATDDVMTLPVPAMPRAQAERVASEQARDRALVETALGGDLDAFNRLVELHQDYLYGVAVRVVGTGRPPRMPSRRPS